VRWAVLVLAAAAVTGCGGNDTSGAGASASPAASNRANDLAALVPQQIRDRGSLNVGNSPVYPPLSFLPEGTEDAAKRQGFDVDLSRAIGAKLGLEVTFVTQPYEQYIPSLQTGRIDLIHSGMQDLEERRATVDFVDYYTTGPQFFALASTASELQSEGALCGRVAVVDSGDVGYREAIKNYSSETCEAAGRPAVKELLANGTADALLQLDQGRGDVTVRGAESVRFLVKDAEAAGKYAIIGDPIAEIPVGIGVNKDNEGLREAVAKALTALMDDGTYAEIGEKWGLSDLLRDKVTVNGVG
jgi:polar amino acid transport system substrate-binding protein